MVDKLVDALANMQEDEALKLTQEYLDHGTDPRQVLEFARQAMDVVGERYAKGEYFLPELVLAGEMLTKVSAIVKPKLVGASPEAKKHGKVLIGTVKGDIHDIGKNIVTFMLDVNGFDVKDIGIDVQPSQFVAEIKAFQPQVVALSGFLTLAYDSMKETVAAIQAAGQRGKVKIMIGGGQMSDKIKEYAGADAYGKDAMAAVTLAKGWIK